MTNPTTDDLRTLLRDPARKAEVDALLEELEQEREEVEASRRLEAAKVKSEAVPAGYDLYVVERCQHYEGSTSSYFLDREAAVDHFNGRLGEVNSNVSLHLRVFRAGSSGPLVQAVSLSRQESDLQG
jgi:hypothetical protein